MLDGGGSDERMTTTSGSRALTVKGCRAGGKPWIAVRFLRPPRIIRTTRRSSLPGRQGTAASGPKIQQGRCSLTNPRSSLQPRRARAASAESSDGLQPVTTPLKPGNLEGPPTLSRAKAQDYFAAAPPPARKFRTTRRSSLPGRQDAARFIAFLDSMSHVSDQLFQLDSRIRAWT